MRALKIVLIILLLLVLLFGGCAYLVYKNIDRIFIGAFEAVASEILQTEVEVDDVNFDLGKGRGEISGIQIANLGGYEEPRLFSLNKAALQIDGSTLNGPVLVIEELLVDGARLTVEHKNLTDTNLQQLLDNLQQNAQRQDQPQDSASEMNFMVEKLAFTNITMEVVSPEFERTTITLPDIRRSDLGNRQTGLTGEELAEAVIKPLLESARQGLQGRVERELGNRLQRELESQLSD